MTVEQRHEDRRCTKNRRHRHSDRRKRYGKRDNLWVSPGALYWLVGLSCAIALIVVFFVVPFYRDRNARHVEEKARQVQLKQDQRLRASQRRQGAMLLHGFDCTYGRGIRLTLKEAARSAGVSAHVALQARHGAILRGDRKAAHRSLVSYRNSSAAARQYRRVAASLKPLGTHDQQGNPFPPCPS